MNSHEFARDVKEAAEYLLSRPAFETATSNAAVYLGGYYSNKEGFIYAAKALGNVEKKYDQHDLTLTITKGANLWLTAPRSLVCRKVQDEKWECEPLLTSEEEESL